MKTAIRQESVRFGRVVQCGRRGAIVLAYDTGKEIRLHWSHLRKIEHGPGGGRMFSTGETRKVHEQDEAVFVPCGNGFWYWGLLSEYSVSATTMETADQVESIPPAESLPPPSPTELDAEISALGNERIKNFQRRYPGYRPLSAP